ncbi:MAG: TlpA disulfide reductase family protein [Mycobacteriales bacterium]
MTHAARPIPGAAAGRRWLRPAIGVAVGIVALLVLQQVRTPGQSTEFGGRGPAQALPNTQLASTTLPELQGMLVGLRGRAVVVNIWASWCGPCRAEMPLLQRAATTYGGKAVILGVASKDNVGAAKAFLEDVGVDYPNVFDSTGDIRQAMGLRGFPTTYFFNADGRLVATVVGGISEARLAAQLDELT